MSDAIDAFFDTYDPRVAALARSTRDLVTGLFPKAEEKLHEGWKTVAYARTKTFCAISPHGAWVNLQLHSGAELPDPEALLSGTGKSMRHVRIDTPEMLERAALTRLLRAAADLSG